MAIKWYIAQGGYAKAASYTGGSVYARSHDGRFIILVKRDMRGDPGFREYIHYFDALDLALPGDHRWGPIKASAVYFMRGGYKVEYVNSAKRIKEMVEQWAKDHPYCQ